MTAVVAAEVLVLWNFRKRIPCKTHFFFVIWYDQYNNTAAFACMVGRSVGLSAGIWFLNIRNKQSTMAIKYQTGACMQSQDTSTIENHLTLCRIKSTHSIANGVGASKESHYSFCHKIVKIGFLSSAKRIGLFGCTRHAHTNVCVCGRFLVCLFLFFPFSMNVCVSVIFWYKMVVGLNFRQRFRLFVR